MGTNLTDTQPYDISKLHFLCDKHQTPQPASPLKGGEGLLAEILNIDRHSISLDKGLYTVRT